MLHIQKFIEDEPGGNDFGSGGSGGNGGGGNFRPVKPEEDSAGARLYIQKGSKMNDGAFDDDAPF